jgi:hypothetical protein
VESRATLATFSTSIAETRSQIGRLNDALAAFDDSVAKSEAATAAAAAAALHAKTARRTGDDSGVRALQSLPAAVLGDVLLLQLQAPDVLRLQATCRSLRQVLRDNAMWKPIALVRWRYGSPFVRPCAAMEADAPGAWGAWCVRRSRALLQGEFRRSVACCCRLVGM